jgi:iron complex outermembrane receptor protein
MFINNIPGKNVLKTLPAAIALGLCGTAAAEEDEALKRSAASIMLEEVVVTATKKASAEQLQDIPIAATAYSEDQLLILNVRDLKGLSHTMPNVSMDESGTTKGVANFSFRGLGVNSSIPSVDPTVGVFIDGVYLGTNYGVVFDQFDLAGIEVLRGPQGLLFGRNVTGGAVVVNTKNPTSEFEGSIRTAIESGLNKYVMASVSGPVIEDKLLAKLAVYMNDDDGYFDNKFNGNNDFGESRTELIRGGMTWLGDESAELTVKYEHGKSDGDGPASQNHALFQRDSLDFSIDEEGFYDTEWDFVSAKYTVDLGAGVLTNIIGWRDMEHATLIDADATPIFGFHASSVTQAEQFSEELRYNITLDDWVDVTAGFYYFTQDLTYVEHRSIAGGALNLNGGGTLDQTTVGIFASADWRLSDTVTLNTGVRYTIEEKSAKLATFSPLLPCRADSASCLDHDFDDDEEWANVTPKIGVQWFVDENTQVYASYSKGFRSGGYNMRNVSPTVAPGPFDEEEQDSFEIGVKLDTLEGRLRLNAAAFYNTITDMQREVLVPDETAGTAQTIQNTADATISGVELELTAVLTEQLLLGVNLGILDGDYDKVEYDISGDGLVDDTDEGLSLPRLAPLSAGVSLTWQDEIFSGHSLLARVSFNHRDEAAYNDNNVGYLNAVDIVDANISFTTADESITVSVFGRNLKDEVSHGGNTPLPRAPLFGYSGGSAPSFSPLTKGRIYGAEFAYRF